MGQREGGGRNSHGYMHVPLSIDPWNDTAESTAPGKSPFIFGFLIFWPKLVPRENNGPNFPFPLDPCGCGRRRHGDVPWFRCGPPHHHPLTSRDRRTSTPYLSIVRPR